MNQVHSVATISQIVLEHQIAEVMTMHDLNQSIRHAERFIF
ncbi:MAG: hypothetical protein AB7S61_06010 [Methanoregulaceae archaeon]